MARKLLALSSFFFCLLFLVSFGSSSSSSSSTPSSSSSSPSLSQRNSSSPTSSSLVRRRHLQSTAACFSTSAPLEWTSEQGELRVGGFPFHLKGISWFGFETQEAFPHGLWQGPGTADRIFRFLRDNGFNALRVPFSAKFALNPNQVVQVADPAFDGLGNLARLARFVDMAAQYNILVMPDMHRITTNGGIPDLWYDNNIDSGRMLQGWFNVMDALVGKWNIFAVDLKNEPHGSATWGSGNRGTDWKLAAEWISTELYRRYPQWHGLVFIEGVTNPTVNSRQRDYNPTWWGGSLEGVWDFPINLGRDDWNRRIVYSPHVYGPDVYNQGYFNAGDFPNNMPRIWQAQFGFAESVQGNHAVVIGEWGGLMGRGPTGWRDRVWADALGDYMIRTCLADNFYWAVNPNSGDTGGILEDNWTTPVQIKLDLLALIQPNPSLLYWTPGGDSVCLNPGAYGNGACRRG